MIKIRVIAGQYKGRPINPVPGKLTRPTSDKVKESLFNRLGPYFSGGLGLDLFAGSGNLGIEALSRGLERVVFVDQQKEAIRVIHQNIAMFPLDNRVEVYRNDAFRALKALHKREFKFDYVFLDPPYKKGLYEQLLADLSKYQLTSDQAIIVCEHETSNVLPIEVGSFSQIRSEKYGGMTTISLYKRKEDEIE
ncbi:16S rRNA (guanine(966)-N(2))-methyltransferase RsmD [Amphibacillus marinus]|uniref:16S rRNA (guanine(966)-N(2))-methyltransferase RsmD n=1 Tax=Amphibacillus marinus TaxID=872970 RepID=UPI003CCBD7EF